MKLTIVYDNNAKPGLKAGGGFSCLVENKKNILFDTGDNGAKLIYNLKKLNKNINDIDYVVLSHEHWDHIDGLDTIKTSVKGQINELKKIINKSDDKINKILDDILKYHGKIIDQLICAANDFETKFNGFKNDYLNPDDKYTHVNMFKDTQIYFNEFNDHICSFDDFFDRAV